MSSQRINEHLNANKSIHHKSMNEQDADRLLEEITLSKNAVEKNYIKIGELYNHSSSSKQKVIINNENAFVENLDVYDSKGFYKTKTIGSKGLFFTLSDSFYKSKDFEDTVINLQNQGYIPKDSDGSVLKRFGVLALGEYNNNGEMLGTKLTLGFKNDSNIVEPFSEIFTTGAGRTTGDVVINNGVKKQASLVATETIRGRVIADASATEMAKAITIGLSNVVTSKEKNVLEYYVKEKSFENTFFPFQFTEAFEQYNQINTVYAKNIVRVGTSLLENNFEQEKYFGVKKAISYNFYKDVFGASSSKGLDNSKILKGSYELGKTEQISNTLSNITENFSLNEIEEHKVNMFSDNIGKFLTNTNLVDVKREINEHMQEEVYIRFADTKSKYIADEFSKYLNGKVKTLLNTATEKTTGGKETFNAINNVLENFSIQDSFVEYLTQKNSNTKINISTLTELSKKDDFTELYIPKTVSFLNEPEFPASIMVRKDIYEKQSDNVRSFLMNKDITKSKALNLTYNLNKNSELEINVPLILFNKDKDEYYYKKITIKADNDVQEFRTNKEITEMSYALRTTPEKAKHINDMNAERRMVELNFANDKIVKGDAKKLNIAYGQVNDLDLALQLYNKDDIFRINGYGSQTSTMAGKAIFGNYGSGSNTPLSTLGDHRQPIAQSENVMFTQNIHGVNITDKLMDNYTEHENLSERTLIKGKPFVSKEQLRLEQETEKIEGSTKSRNNLTGYSFYLNDETTWQENMVITKELKEKGFFAGDQTLTVRFNQINDNFFSLKEVADMDITKKNIASVFKSSEEKANKIIALLLTDDFNEKIKNSTIFQNKDVDEINKAVSQYANNPNDFLLKKGKNGKAILLKQEYLNKSANIGVKADFGIGYNGFEYDNDSFKLKLNKIKIADEGGKISANGSKGTIANIFDKITAVSEGKNFSGVMTFNAKSENRKQAGFELYNILRTSLYNLSETNKDNYDNFLKDGLVKQTLKTLGLNIDKDNKIVEELIYKDNFEGYGKFVENILDHHAGIKSGVKDSGNFEEGLKKIAYLLTGNKDSKIDLAEIATGILGKYEEYGKQNGANFVPILLKNATMVYEKNGVKLKSAAKNIYRFVTSITRPSVTETKRAEDAVNLDSSAIRLLKEKGQLLLATTLEDMIYEQGISKESVELNKFLMYSEHHVRPSDFGDFLEHTLKENDNEFVKINFSNLGKDEIEKLADAEYITSKRFFSTTVGKVIEEKELLDGEHLEKNVVSIIESDKVKRYMKGVREHVPKTNITFSNLKKDIVDIIENNFDEVKRKELILEYVRNNYMEALSNENYRIYSYSVKSNPHLNNQYRSIFEGDYVGISNIDELAIDKEGKVIANEGINVLKRWARAEEAIGKLNSGKGFEKTFEKIADIATNIEKSEIGYALLQQEIDKPAEVLKTVYNLVDKSTTEKFKQAKGMLSNNLTTVRIKNSFMAAPANNDLIFQAFANNVYRKDFEEHLIDFFGEDIAKKLNNFERVDFKDEKEALSAISKTKENFIKNLKDLNDVVITRKEIIQDNLGLKDSFIKTKTGIERTFGKYVGYPMQTVANLSSSLLIMFDNKSENIFAREAIKAGFMDSDKSKQLFFLNKKTWFKALRDFDGDKAQYMFNVIKDYKENKGLINKLILRDKYEFLNKNGVEIPEEMLEELKISKQEHAQNLMLDKFRERWYDMKLKKEIGKHDLHTQNVISYFLDKAVNENISVADSIKTTYENLISKYDFKTDKFLKEMSEEEKEILNDIKKSKRFKVSRSTPLHSVEQAKATMKTLTGIKDTGKVHSGVTQFRKLIGNIAFNELDDSFKSRLKNGTNIIEEIQNRVRSNVAEFSELAGMLIEDGAISAKHGQNALVPSLVKMFEREIKTSYKDYEESKAHFQNSKKIYQLSKANSLEEYDKIYADISGDSKHILSEVSDFINSSMGAGFDIEKFEFEHKKLAASVLSQVTEVGDFIKTSNSYAGKGFFKKNKEDLLYKMDITNNLFSKTSKQSDEQIHNTIAALFDDNTETYKKPFKDNFLNKVFKNTKKYFDNQVENFNSTKALSQLENIEDFGIESLKEGNNAENVATLIKSIRSGTIPQEAVFDMAEEIMKIKNGEIDATSGRKALNEFSKLLNSGGVVMEGAAIHTGEKTLNITERTFGIIKKMIK